MKKLLILALFCLAMGLFTPKVVKAKYDSCYSGGDWGTVICGPDIASKPNGDGSSNVLWAGENKNLVNFTVLQASLYLTKNARISMRNNSVLTFDGLGCSKDDIDQCSLTSDAGWGKNILSIDSSEFFHGSGNNPIFYMKDVNSIRMENNSIATFGIIKDNNKYTMLEFSVKDSDLSVNQIAFENPNSWINSIDVKNSENNRGKYRVNINNGIRVSRLYGITLTNADMIIGGDIVAYGTNGSGGGITPVYLENSDLILNGNEISQIVTINLIRGSNFKVDPRSGYHTIVMGAGNPTIMLEEGSTMTAKDIRLNTPSLDISASGEKTVFYADKIYFDSSNNDFTGVNMDLRLASKVNIGVLDTSVNCSQGCSMGDKRISFGGDKQSSYNIGKIIIQDDHVSLNTASSFVNIDNLDYKGSVLKIASTVDTKVVEGIHIGHINFLQDATKTGYSLNFQKQKIQINDINLKKTDVLEINADNSSINLGNVSCVSCKITNFKGIGDNTSIVMNNFDSKSSNASDFQNTFTGINLNVAGVYKGSGTFNASSSTLNFNSLIGQYDSIKLINSSMILNGKSNISFTNGAIEIDGGSSFTIKGEQTFNGGNPITINNNGYLDILVANNFDKLNNNGIATLDGKSHIRSVVNNGHLDKNNNKWVNGIINLYSGASIENLSNNDGQIIVYGDNYIQQFDATKDSSLLFNVNTKQRKPGLTIGSMNPYTGSLGIKISSLVVLKPGLKNRYEIIKTENGPIGINHKDFSSILDVLPPWLVHEEAIESNGSGETAWINIQRLTDYKSLIRSVPGYGSDNSMMNIATLIDTNVFDAKVTLGLEDIVNSLDLNSSCDLSDQLIYEVHQGKRILDVTQAPCLYTMAKHMNTLKPVQNEVYALYSHTNMVKSLDTLLEANREYVYSNEIYSWYKGDIGYTSLDDKGYNSGFKSVNSMFFVGASISPWNYFNVSGMLGFGLGNINGNNSLFNGVTNSFTAGLAGSYLSNASYYVSMSSVIGLTNFNTNRNITFLDNPNSDNRNSVSKSSPSILELAIKSEAGKEFVVTSTTFLTPKIFASQSVLRNSGYKEFGSSASLTVDASNLLITDVGAGLELRRELLLPDFLGIHTAFWYPKLGINFVERFYNSPDTKMRFYGVSDNSYANIIGANYSGILGQVYASVLYQSQSFAIQTGYSGDISVSGYMNHSLNAIVKYSFR